MESTYWFWFRFSIFQELTHYINHQSFRMLRFLFLHFFVISKCQFNQKTRSYLPWNPVATILLRTVIVLSRYYLELGLEHADQAPLQGQISSKASFLDWPVIIFTYSSHYLSLFSRSNILICVRTVPKMITINLKCYFVQIIVSISHLSIHSWFTQ